MGHLKVRELQQVDDRQTNRRIEELIGEVGMWLWYARGLTMTRSSAMEYLNHASSFAFEDTSKDIRK